MKRGYWPFVLAGSLLGVLFWVILGWAGADESPFTPPAGATRVGVIPLIPHPCSILLPVEKV